MSLFSNSTGTSSRNTNRMTMSPHADVEKRVLDDHEDASETTIVSKKRKVATSPEVHVKEPSDDKVCPHELASAFALASLARLSPDRQNNTANSHAKPSVQSVLSYEEARSPKADQAPTSPEQRSPGSPKSQNHADAQDDRSVDSSKRVHFAQGTKEHPVTPSASMNSMPMNVAGRRLVPPNQRQVPVGLRHRNPYHMNGFMRSPPPPPHPVHHQAAFPPSQPWFHRAAGGRMYPPHPRLMQPALLHPEPSNQWICDFCNVASFSTFDQACAHEEVCKTRMGRGSAGQNFSGMMPVQHGSPPELRSLMSRSSSGDDDCTAATIERSASSDSWFTGSLSLGNEESDREWLSELNCVVRSQCVEAFSATEEDVARSSKRGRITLHQVGIRCRFCMHLPAKEKAVAAVSFPTSINGIYESVKRWQRVHFETCESIPVDVRNKLTVLANTNVWVPTTRQYWADSAKVLGLVDTTEGIRFGINPTELRAQSVNRAHKVFPPQQGHQYAAHHHPQLMLQRSRSNESAFESTRPPALDQAKQQSDGAHIVFPEDVEMIPPYVYFLMRQVEPCRFTEADRFVARSKGPVGYPGFQCRHCNGHAGLGKYFPVSSKSLSTNSTSQNIHAHLLKCRKCPEHVKDQLVQLKIEKGRSPRLEPGWRKIFFDKVWGRLHG